MTTDVIDAVREHNLASTGEAEQAIVRLLAIQDARYVREQEEAGIEAEGYWGQAEEACAVDPIG